MPLYEYRCDACGTVFERIQKFSDPLVTVCPKCGGGPVHKLISSPAFQFKGSGWYVTDYARAGKTGEPSSGPKSDSSSGGEKTDKGEKGEKSEKSEKSDKSDGAKPSTTDKTDTSTKADTPAKTPGSTTS